MAADVGLIALTIFEFLNLRRQWHFQKSCLYVQTLLMHFKSYPFLSQEIKGDLYLSQNFSLLHSVCVFFLWRVSPSYHFFLEIIGENYLCIQFEWSLFWHHCKLKKLSDLYFGQNFSLLGFVGEMAHACVKLILLTV